MIRVICCCSRTEAEMILHFFGSPFGPQTANLSINLTRGVASTRVFVCHYFPGIAVNNAMESIPHFLFGCFSFLHA